MPFPRPAPTRGPGTMPSAPGTACATDRCSMQTAASFTARRSSRCRPGKCLRNGRLAARADRARNGGQGRKAGDNIDGRNCGVLLILAVSRSVLAVASCPDFPGGPPEKQTPPSGRGGAWTPSNPLRRGNAVRRSRPSIRPTVLSSIGVCRPAKRKPRRARGRGGFRDAPGGTKVASSSEPSSQVNFAVS
jgi:hypothetical protein